MKKALLILLSVLLCLNVFAGCGGGGESKETIVGADGTFSVEVPTSWEDATGDLNDVASLEVSNEDHECYLMAIPDAKGSFTGDLDDFTAIVHNQVANLYGLSSLGEPEEVTVDGNKAYAYNFDISHSGLEATMWWFCVETDGYFVQVATWTLKDNADKYGQELVDIALSFKEI